VKQLLTVGADCAGHADLPGRGFMHGLFSGVHSSRPLRISTLNYQTQDESIRLLLGLPNP
jgi:hypothetical protein